jgi:hypothetical protein
MRYAVALSLLAAPAWAECGGYDSTFLFCQIENSAQTLSVCFDEVTANYRFGIEFETPELDMTAPIATLDYTLWPGAGSTIWEEVVFYNQNYSYTVAVAVRRDIPDDPDALVKVDQFGGVIVKRDNVEIVNLTCDPATIYIDRLGGLSEAKKNLGYSWNVADQGWVELPD